jgi:hypothetical protein
MKRDYSTGEADNAIFFFGKEVEHTPAYGMYTLFVTDVQPIEAIEGALAGTTYETNHIFFGANHSFKPAFNDFNGWKIWEDMITHFLEKEYLCSLDIPLSAVEEFHDGGLNDYNNFIPQIRVPIPYIKLWNYNTMLKIDDKDFKATNPGVWSHSLHDLKDRSKFTDWSQYNNDTILK